MSDCGTAPLEVEVPETEVVEEEVVEVAEEELEEPAWVDVETVEVEGKEGCVETLEPLIGVEVVTWVMELEVVGDEVLVVFDPNAA